MTPTELRTTWSRKESSSAAWAATDGDNPSARRCAAALRSRHASATPAHGPNQRLEKLQDEHGRIHEIRIERSTAGGKSAGRPQPSLGARTNTSERHLFGELPGLLDVLNGPAFENPCHRRRTNQRATASLSAQDQGHSPETCDHPSGRHFLRAAGHARDLRNCPLHRTATGELPSGGESNGCGARTRTWNFPVQSRASCHLDDPAVVCKRIDPTANPIQ